MNRQEKIKKLKAAGCAVMELPTDLIIFVHYSRAKKCHSIVSMSYEQFDDRSLLVLLRLAGVIFPASELVN